METISTGNEESLFVDGDSEDEPMQSGSESESPQKRPTNGDGPKLDATASPFRPFVSPALGMVPGSSPFPTLQSGKATGKSLAQTSHAEYMNPLDVKSKLSTQTMAAPVSTTEKPKFDLFAPATMNQKQEVKQSSDSRSGNEPLKFEFGAAAKTSQPSNTNNSLGSSLFVKPPGPTPSFLDQSSTNASVLFPAPQTTVSDQPSTSSAFIASGPAKSLFDKPPTTSTPPTFSFGTSPLFQPVTKDQLSTTQNTELSPQQNDVLRKPPLLSTLAASNAPANTFFTPPKPTVESASPSPTSSTFTPGIPPTSASSVLQDPKPAQPASFTPESTTEGLFQPSHGSNMPQSLLTSTYQKPNTGNLSQQVFPATSSLPIPGFSTSSTGASAFSGSTAVGTISGSSPRDTVALSAIPPDPRSDTLDKLADAMMLGEKGLLQQFVEFTVGPIIQSSIKQLEDEDSWEQARQSHLTLGRYHAGLLIWSRGVSCDIVKQEVS